ncbi:MAG: ABC transporter ATP-binding protein [Clostridium sp.]
MKIIKLEGIYKAYNGIDILKNFNLEVSKGEFIGIKGESGVGKSTLLNIIGLLESYEGNIFLEGKKINIKKRIEIRNILKKKIGYLFQNFALIDDLTVYENIKIVLKKGSAKERRNMVLEKLRDVGLGDILDKKVFQLSGGEQQRVAIARLIIHGSDIILADEPTGSLDTKNCDIVMDILERLNSEGKTIIIVSHDERVLSRCSRVVTLNKSYS